MYIVGRGRYAREAYPQSAGAGGGGGGGFPFISVLNTLALAGFPVTGLVEGQPAAIRDRFSLWAYNPEDASAADGNHIPSTTGPGCWVYTGAFDAATQANSTLWVVDPANSSGTASNDNDGHSNVTALLTFEEVVRRCGGRSPDTGATAIEVRFLSGQPNSTDPIAFQPVGIAATGTSVLFDAVLQAPAFTGTLATVTPKNNTVAPGNPLSVTVNTTTGAFAAGLLLVNATRGNSRARVARNTGGANFEISQPVVPWSGSGFYSPSEVDTWAPGDAITGFALPTVHVQEIGIESAHTFLASFVQTHQISLGDAGGAGLDLTTLYGAVQLIDSDTPGSVDAEGLITFIANCYSATTNRFTGSADYFTNGGFFGSGIGIAFFSRMIFTLDTILGPGGGIFFEPIEIENGLCLDGGYLYQAGGLNELFAGPGSALYGAGSFNNQSGIVLYTAPAVQTFLATISLSSLATGYSRATAAGLTTIHGGIALTAANLDAAAGAAGFGGYAEGGGAVFTTGAQP